MSSINTGLNAYRPVQPSEPPQGSTNPPPASTKTPQTLSTLLGSEPGWGNPPAKAPAATAPTTPASDPAPNAKNEQASGQRFNGIRDMLSERNIKALLTNPESPEAIELLSHLKGSINKKSLGTLRGGSPPEETSKALGEIGARLTQSALDKGLNESLSTYVKSIEKQYEMERFDNSLKLALADPEAAWSTAISQWDGLQAEILASQAHARHIKENASALRSLGELLNSSASDPDAP